MTIRRTAGITALVGILALAGCTTPSANSSPGPQSNADLVREFYETTFIDRDVESAASRFIGDDYIQHNPFVGDGIDGFVEGISALLDSQPNLNTTIHRVIADDELVAVHSEMSAESGERGQSVMDIFRVEDGRIIEHWDAIQDVPETQANQNTMFDGPTNPADEVNIDDQQHQVSAVLDFLDMTFNSADARTAVDQYVGADYVQHNPFVADGGDAFVAAFTGAQALEGDDRMIFPRTLVQGDMVVVQTFTPGQGDNSGTGSIDIFRFDGAGKIVEHWDAVQEYEGETASGNSVWDDGQ